MELLFLVLGVAGLWIGTELTIGGALSLAKQHSLSDFFVGLAILSIGSDLPELAIAIDSGIKNSLGGNVSGIVVGTSIGSVAGQLSSHYWFESKRSRRLSSLESWFSSGCGLVPGCINERYSLD